MDASPNDSNRVRATHQTVHRVMRWVLQNTEDAIGM